ncbi:putative epsin [Paratrimastix pyriformis]|uniref:Epsin n=1 Tax=Paratrimastix pyriformis TaxID=342808 RepID=A0ABQ8UU48_9EUKA|nr:putative epsin [Paratrimastix pyriformis]
MDPRLEQVVKVTLALPGRRWIQPQITDHNLCCRILRLQHLQHGVGTERDGTNRASVIGRGQSASSFLEQSPIDGLSAFCSVRARRPFGPSSTLTNTPRFSIAILRKTAIAGTDIERMVKKATSDEPGPADSEIMRKISDATNRPVCALLITYHVFWAVVALQALLLLEYMLRCGSQQVLQEARDQIYRIRSLMSYQYIDEKQIDQGANIREKAKFLTEFINDDAQITEAREEARRTRDKYSGLGSGAWQGTGSGGGYGGGMGSSGSYGGGMGSSYGGGTGSSYGGGVGSSRYSSGEDDYNPSDNRASGYGGASSRYSSGSAGYGDDDYGRPASSRAPSPPPAPVRSVPAVSPAPRPTPMASTRSTPVSVAGAKPRSAPPRPIAATPPESDSPLINMSAMRSAPAPSSTTTPAPSPARSAGTGAFWAATSAAQSDDDFDPRAAPKPPQNIGADFFAGARTAAPVAAPPVLSTSLFGGPVSTASTPASSAPPTPTPAPAPVQPLSTQASPAATPTPAPSPAKSTPPLAYQLFAQAQQTPAPTAQQPDLIAVSPAPAPQSAQPKAGGVFDLADLAGGLVGLLALAAFSTKRWPISSLYRWRKNDLPRDHRAPVVVSPLTRNINEGHVREIFSKFGDVKRVDFPIDPRANLPRGFAYIEYMSRADAERAVELVNNSPIDGEMVTVKFVLPRKRVPPPRRSPARRSPARRQPEPLSEARARGQETRSCRPRGQKASGCTLPVAVLFLWFQSQPFVEQKRIEALANLDVLDDEPHPAPALQGIRRSANTGPKGVLADYREACARAKAAQAAEQQAILDKLKQNTPYYSTLDQGNDEELQALRQRRMSELKATQGRRTTSYGHVREVTPDQYVDIVDHEDPMVSVVVHLFEPGQAACMRLNELLESLAQQYPQINFLRVVASAAKPDFDPLALPTLLLYRGGRVVAAIVRALEEMAKATLGDSLPSVSPPVPPPSLPLAPDTPWDTSMMRSNPLCAAASRPAPPPARPTPEVEAYLRRQLGYSGDAALLGVGAMADLRAAQRRVEALLREVDVSDLEQLLIGYDALTNSPAALAEAATQQQPEEEEDEEEEQDR